MVLNFLSFCLSVKLFLSPSYLHELLTGYSNLGCRFFFHHFKYVLPFPPGLKVSIERSADILMGITLCVICCFSFAAFNICSLCLIFVNLINMCLGGVSPWVYPVWDSLGFLDLGDYFFPHFREVFNYYLLKYFLMVFLFVFFWESYDSNIGAFNIVPEVSEVVLVFLKKFF